MQEFSWSITNDCLSVKENKKLITANLRKLKGMLWQSGDIEIIFDGFRVWLAKDDHDDTIILYCALQCYLGGMDGSEAERLARERAEAESEDSGGAEISPIPEGLPDTRVGTDQEAGIEVVSQDGCCVEGECKQRQNSLIERDELKKLREKHEKLREKYFLACNDIRDMRVKLLLGDFSAHGT